MRFVDHHEIPRCGMDVPRFVAGELIGADDNGVRFGLERAVVTLLDCGVVRSRFQNLAGQEEFLAHFLMPLLPQVRRRDNENPPFPFRPFLRNDQTRFDSFSQTHFIRKDRALG